MLYVGTECEMRNEYHIKIPDYVATSVIFSSPFEPLKVLARKYFKKVLQLFLRKQEKEKRGEILY